ncbi:MAG: hypothetical protein ACP5G7_11220 [Anaerolineae bacterium]
MRALDEAGHEPVGVDRVAPTGSVAAYLFVACDLTDEALFVENPHASAFAIRKAERLLGYRPTHRWQDYEAWERL